jgi:hypothetical protein
MKPIVHLKDEGRLLFVIVNGQEQRRCWTKDERFLAEGFAREEVRKQFAALNRDRAIVRRNAVTFESFCAGAGVAALMRVSV